MMTKGHKKQFLTATTQTSTTMLSCQKAGGIKMMFTNLLSHTTTPHSHYMN